MYSPYSAGSAVACFSVPERAATVDLFLLSVSLSHTLSCADQELFRGLLHSRLDSFSVEELREQLRQLQRLCKTLEVHESQAVAEAAGDEGSGMLKPTAHGPMKNKSQRRMLRRQMVRVQAQIDVLENKGSADGQKPTVPAFHQHYEALPGHFKKNWNAVGQSSAGKESRWCRACGVSEPEHDGPLGTCWGMYVDIFAASLCERMFRF